LLLLLANAASPPSKRGIKDNKSGRGIYIHTYNTRKSGSTKWTHNIKRHERKKGLNAVLPK